jgi:hypothetical protein
MNSGKKYSKKKSTKSQVKEPSVVYGADKGKKLSIFNSFEEAEADNYEWLASQTPEEHLKNAVKLIKRIYAEDLKKYPLIEKKLIIVK